MHSFSSVIGHTFVQEVLKKALREGLVHHAYVFVGPKHTGKGTVTTCFCKALLCQSRTIERPCHHCLSCQYFDRGIHPDFHEIQKLMQDTGDKHYAKTKKNIGIEQIKKGEQYLRQSALLSGYKAMVVSDADSLSEKAANAILKTLEEPPNNTVIILIYEHDGNITPTIRSRSHLMRFYPVSTADIYDHLVRDGADRDTAKILAHLSLGLPGKAIAWNQNKKLFEEYTRTASRCLSLLVLPLYQKLTQGLKDLPSQKNQLNAEDVQGMVDVWIKLLRDMLLEHHSSNELMHNIFLKKNIQSASAHFSPSRIYNAIHILFAAKQLLHANISPRQVYENFLIQI